MNLAKYYTVNEESLDRVTAYVMSIFDLYVRTQWFEKSVVKSNSLTDLRTEYGPATRPE